MVIAVLTFAAAAIRIPPCPSVPRSVPARWVSVRLESAGLTLRAPAGTPFSISMREVVDAVLVGRETAGVAISLVSDTSTFDFTFDTPADDTTAVCHVEGRERQTQWRVFPYTESWPRQGATVWGAKARIPLAAGRALVVAVSAPTRVQLGRWIRSVSASVDRLEVRQRSNRSG